MNQNVSHTFNNIPFNLRMSVAKLFCKHIYGFTDNLDMFHKSIEYNRIVYNALVFVFVFIIEYCFNGRQNVLKPTLVFNLFSHK